MKTDIIYTLFDEPGLLMHKPFLQVNCNILIVIVVVENNNGVLVCMHFKTLNNFHKFHKRLNTVKKEATEKDWSFTLPAITPTFYAIT